MSQDFMIRSGIQMNVVGADRVLDALRTIEKQILATGAASTRTMNRMARETNVYFAAMEQSYAGQRQALGQKPVAARKGAMGDVAGSEKQMANAAERELKRVTNAYNQNQAQQAAALKRQSAALRQHQQEVIQNLTYLGVAISAFGIKASKEILEITTEAARAEELQVAMRNMATVLGYNIQAVDEYEASIRGLNIRTDAARETLLLFMRMNLDVAKATQLARIAQDAAVISMEDSSDAVEGILHGIMTLQPRVLRTHGIIVNLDMAYRDYAKSMGATAESLTMEQKQEIALQEVLKQGVRLQGTYEAAMATTSKQMRSVLGREVYETKRAFGEHLIPTLGLAVQAFQKFNDGLQAMDPVLQGTVSRMMAFSAGFTAIAGTAMTFLALAPRIISALTAINILKTVTATPILGLAGDVWFGPMALPVLGLTVAIGVIATLAAKQAAAAEAQKKQAAEAFNTAESYRDYSASLDNAARKNYGLSESIWKVLEAQRAQGEYVTGEQIVAAQEAMKKAIAEVFKGQRGVGSLLGIEEAFQKAQGYDITAGVTDYELIARRKEFEQASDELRAVNMFGPPHTGYTSDRQEAASRLADAYYRMATAQKEAFGGLKSFVGGLDQLQLTLLSTSEGAADFLMSLGMGREEAQRYSGILVQLAQEQGKLNQVIEDDAKLTEARSWRWRKQEDALTDAQRATNALVEAQTALNNALETGIIARYTGFLGSLSTALGQIRAANKNIADVEVQLKIDKGDLLQKARDEMADIAEDFAEAMSEADDDFAKATKKAGLDLAGQLEKIAEKVNKMMPEATPDEERLQMAGDAWDEWARRWKAAQDNVFNATEAGWLNETRTIVKNTKWAMLEGETVYGWMARLIEGFYEGDEYLVEEFANKETATWKWLEIQRAEALANETEEAKKEYGKQLQQAKLIADEMRKVAQEERDQAEVDRINAWAREDLRIKTDAAKKKAALAEERKMTLISMALQAADMGGQAGSALDKWAADYTKAMGPGWAAIFSDADKLIGFIEQGLVTIGEAPGLESLINKFGSSFPSALADTQEGIDANKESIDGLVSAWDKAGKAPKGLQTGVLPGAGGLAKAAADLTPPGMNLNLLSFGEVIKTITGEIPVLSGEAQKAALAASTAWGKAGAAIYSVWLGQSVIPDLIKGFLGVGAIASTVMSLTILPSINNIAEALDGISAQLLALGTLVEGEESYIPSDTEDQAAEFNGQLGTLIEAAREWGDEMTFQVDDVVIPAINRLIEKLSQIPAEFTTKMHFIDPPPGMGKIIAPEDRIHGIIKEMQKIPTTTVTDIQMEVGKIKAPNVMDTQAHAPVVGRSGSHGGGGRIIGGDTYVMNITDPRSMAVAQAIVADRQRTRRDQFMGVS